jgi:glycosyltransferase involved in cell wall biosynthesis
LAKILFITQQSIMDPGSGAAVSSQSFATILANAGHEVQSICTTQTEHHLGIRGHEHWLQQTYALQQEETFWHLRLDAINYEFIRAQSASQVIKAFLVRFELALQQFCPDAIITFGDTSVDQKIRRRANQLGIKVIFTLHNISYPNKLLAHVQHYVCPSQYLASHYSQLTSLTTIIYPPLAPKLVECNQDEQQKVFLTFVNPVIEKGLLLAVAIFHTLLKTRPDIPILVVEGRGNAALFLKACHLCGFDPSQHNNLYISSSPMTAKEIMQHTRLVIMPSVIAEAAGRVAMEAMYNGIPSLVSDRGALPEIVANTDNVLALPSTLTLTYREAVKAEDAQPWVDKILSIFDDEDGYRRQSQQVKTFAQEHYHPNITLAGLQKVLKTLQII